MGSQLQEELKGRGAAPHVYPQPQEGPWGSMCGGERRAGGVQAAGNGTCWI